MAMPRRFVGVVTHRPLTRPGLEPCGLWQLSGAPLDDTEGRVFLLLPN